nr:diacylglycerol kinase family protein [Nocardioides perillae]
MINPTAGKGRGAVAGRLAAARLRDAGLVVTELVGRDGDEALDLARAAVERGVDSLVACGGDGLVHLAVQAVARSATPLGVVPAGTGNDVARYLDLPRRDPVAAADRVVARRTRTLDLARCGHRWFTTVLAAGFDAVVNERANAMVWPRGQMRYNLATLAELRTLAPRPYVLDLDGEVRHVEATLVAVGNGSSFGGGLRITEGALLDDGLLDVVVVRPLTRRRLVAAYPRLFRGTVAGLAEHEHHRVRTVTVAAPGIVAYADGERFGALPLTVAADPGALTVYA